jgi:hypothetical protein
MEMRKASVGGSDDGGDKDPPRKNLEKSHIAYTSMKRKRNTSVTGLSIPEVQESPHTMDIDELIEEPSWSAQRLLETREIVDVIITQDPEIFEEESVTLHHTPTIVRLRNCYWKKSILKIKGHQKNGNLQLTLMELHRKKLQNSMEQLEKL